MTETPPSIPVVRSIPAYILAGGKRRRFGSDKARATFRGRPLILTPSDQFCAMGFGVTIVGMCDGQHEDLGLSTIGDIEPGQGPVGGLRTALTHHQAGWILMCSCDMLSIDDSWVTALIGELQRSPDAEVIAARNEVWQPFPALYHTRLLASSVLRDARSFQSLFDRVSVSVITTDDLPIVRQVNTQEELRAAERDAG